MTGSWSFRPAAHTRPTRRLSAAGHGDADVSRLAIAGSAASSRSGAGVWARADGAGTSATRDGRPSRGDHLPWLRRAWPSPVKGDPGGPGLLGTTPPDSPPLPGSRGCPGDASLPPGCPASGCAEACRPDPAHSRRAEAGENPRPRPARLWLGPGTGWRVTSANGTPPGRSPGSKTPVRSGPGSGSRQWQGHVGTSN